MTNQTKGILFYFLPALLIFIFVFLGEYVHYYFNAVALVLALGLFLGIIFMFFRSIIMSIIRRRKEK